MDTRKAEKAVIRKRRELGFTFIEVVLALTLLAVATSILIGLQGSAVQRTIRDRSVQQSMLAARRILASIEASDNDPKIGDQNDIPVLELLRLLNAAELATDDEKKALDPLRASFKIEDWTVPLEGVAQNALRKMTLSISWSSDPRDVFQITYFIPAPEEDPTQ